MYGTATGILMALFLDNAGGEWDSAKKYILNWVIMRVKKSETHMEGYTGPSFCIVSNVRSSS
jgi:H+-translocating diphosphatase